MKIFNKNNFLLSSNQLINLDFKTAILENL